MLGYRVVQGRARIEPQAGLSLCRRLAELIAPNEARVLEELGREAGMQAASEGSSRVREVRVTRLLEPAGFEGSRFYMLSPYVGCLIGCRFCYAQSRLGAARRLLQLAEVPWGSYVDARVNAAEVLASELSAMPRLPVKLCPIVSDPYHAVERSMALTRRCLEVLARRELSPPATFVLTRATLIERDIDVLSTIEGAHAGFSVPTEDDEVRRHFEPRGASIGERLRVLRRLREAGVHAFAVVQPVLTFDVKALAEALASSVDSVRIDVLRGVEGAAADFADARYVELSRDDVQAERAAELSERLVGLGVEVWPDELPASIALSQSAGARAPAASG